MRERLIHAPVWALAAVFGGFFGLSWAVWSRFLEGQSWTRALVTAAIAGVLFGAMMGPVTHRQWRGARELAARSPGGLSREVRRAGWRGPVPSDPVVRQAAHDLLRAQLEPMERQRRWASPFFALMAVLALYLALTDSAWWWWAVAAWTGMAVAHPFTRRRLRRRAVLLGDTGPRP
ncbi:hypothetical protein [Blastococcus brunescens]|uniref:Glycosyl-4,4'-diaponeurosporenoate acyltransferase n=1 Tax=Blastococcus brunescens TaxID=1564165 RepID=A0ABZ1AY92_9ACTN|nr:hypothetical protein [Blastococcus sp. BMG 8361]WRL63537.1 hypothetical protein U6N30_28170 [Blastococcus sp. BMG 8361]